MASRESPGVNSHASGAGRYSHIPRPRKRSSSCDSRSQQTRTTGKSIGEPVRHVSVSPKKSKKSMLSESKVSAPKMSLGVTLGKTPQKSSRVSTMTPGKSRQNITTLQNSTLKDIRPLSDKTYQFEMINMIEQYFMENNQAHILNNNGSLKPISLKIFVDVTNALLEAINVQETLTMSTYIEVIPVLAKKLRYPGVINKAWLKTASAMHAWPNVLGWLSWLTLVAKSKKNMEIKFESEGIPFQGIDTEEQLQNKKKFETIMQGYLFWNDERYEEEEEVLQRFINNEKSVIDEQLIVSEDKLNKEKDKLDKEEQALKSVEEENQRLLEILKSLECTESEMDKFFLTSDKELENLDRKNEIVIKDIEMLKIKKNKEDNDIKKLEKDIEKQPMTVDQRDEKMKNIADNKDCIFQLDKCLEEIRKQQYAMEMKISKLNNEITQSIDEYRRKMYENLNESLLNVNIDSALLEMPVIISDSNILYTVKEKINAICALKQNLRNEIDKTHHRNKSIKTNIEKMEDEQRQLSLCKQEHLEYHKQMEEELIVMNKNFEEMKIKIKKEIHELNQEKEIIVSETPDIDECSKELKESEEKVETLNRRKAFLEERVKHFFARIHTISKEHVEDMDKMMESFAKK